MRRRRSPEIVAGRVNTDGSIMAGEGFAVLKTGTGLYAVTITTPGFRLIAVTFSIYSGNTGIFGNNVTPGGTTFTALTFNTTNNVAGDSSWGFIAAGAQQ